MPWWASVPGTIRVLTTQPLPKPRSAVVRFAIRALFYVGVFVSGTVIFVIGFFLYDASTYRESPSTETLPVSTLALEPRRFGPKNLCVVEHFVDDEAVETAKHRPKLVILGTGWGAVSLIKNLKLEDYHVTVVSPSNQFLFTPMLPSASTGTLELRSLVEPVRKIVSRIHGHFLKAMAVDVCFSEKLVEVEAVDSRGEPVRFYVPYDKLVIACGQRSRDEKPTS
jgi:NADH dehydrogenase